MLPVAILIILTPFLYLIEGWSPALFTLPLAMGGQNAVTTLAGINRTTHLTGPTTDLGISLANKDWNKIFFWSLRLLAFTFGVLFSTLLCQQMKDRPYFIYSLIFPGLIILASALSSDFLAEKLGKNDSRQASDLTQVN